MANWQEEIPREQAAAEAAGRDLQAAEQQLEVLQEGIKDEVEAHHQQLNKVITGGDDRLGLMGACMDGRLMMSV